MINMGRYPVWFIWLREKRNTREAIIREVDELRARIKEPAQSHATGISQGWQVQIRK